MLSGRHFLQVPGPTNLPERVLRAMDRPVIDHRSPEFAELLPRIIPLLREVFGTKDGSIIIMSGSGTGGWESALVNTLKPGDRVLACVNGQFGLGFGNAARKLGFEVEELVLDWGQEVRPDELERRLKGSGGAAIKAVLVVHNETSTGVTSDVGAIRAAMDRAGSDALLLVDTVSSLGSIEFKFDDWRVDVALCGSQKGLMMPPGQAYLCASERALKLSQEGGSPRNFLDWAPMLREYERGLFPFTPNTLMLFGLREALIMLVEEEGLPNVYERHRRLASAVRSSVEAWNLSVMCEKPAFRSNTVTTVLVPDQLDGSEVVEHARSRFNISLGIGVGQSRQRAFRMGHLGSLNELEVIAMVAGVEMTLREMGLPVALGAAATACERSFVQAA
ncbi:MAG: aminotransferase class V-fold PLP-dependent enzyme [Chloroflexi bacterium]|nr:aminotransferase class V-fold PLP-dependent enzyme [Chloroflexota bacterium]